MKRAIQVKAEVALPSEEWVHLFMTYDGSGKADGVRTYVNGKPVGTAILNDSLRLGDSIRTGAVTHLGRRDDDQPVRETRYQDIRFYRRALSAAEVARLPFEDYAAEVVARQRNPERWTDDEAFVVLDQYYLRQKDEVAMQLLAKIKTLESKIDALTPLPKPKPGYIDRNLIILPETKAAPILQSLIAARPASLIAQEKTTPAYAHLLKRGDYASRLERVAPATPHFLPGLPADEPRNRLALANWLFTAEQPLFARVAVNRMWQELFGTGLVESAGDFGVMGDRPSHPKLLDWLAVDFRESGWDVKRLYRMLVLSATYRQSSRVSSELLRIDPANRLLARGPRFRMDAEGIRDSTLAVSGLLVQKIGGPPVKPYQPPGLWQEVAIPLSNTKEYAQDSGQNLYRRSIYTFLKRSSPPPNMETFDATSRETACLRRARTNTPLQTLVTWNDPQFVEAARVLAQKTMRACVDHDSRVNTLARLTLSRSLEQDEKTMVDSFWRAFKKRFDEQPERAKQLLSVGETQPDASLNANELAAWTMVASQFLNLDEFLTK